MAYLSIKIVAKNKDILKGSQKDVRYVVGIYSRVYSATQKHEVQMKWVCARPYLNIDWRR
jgi:predicted site-specific integrase-resolvase